MAAAKHKAMTSEEYARHSAAVAASRPQHAKTDTSTKSDELTVDELSRSSASTRYTNKHRNRSRRNLVRGALIILVALVLVLGASAIAYVNNINSKLSSGVDEELLNVLAEREEKDDPFYMLLLGVDKGEGREEEWGEEYWNYRADTIILARIDPKETKVTLVSIPRDTFVDMHENGQTKINAAYTYGGAPYMVEVVQEFAGVPISHYAEVDFEGFEKIVDQVGGIDITLPVAVRDPEYTGLDLDEGDHHLNGHDALMLARSRHAYDEYGGGDFFRAANQRMVISAVARKVLSSDLVTMSSTISTLAEYVTTDMNATDIISLAVQMKDLDIDKNFYSGQEPTISTYYDDLWYEICDTEAWQRMMQRVDAGLPPYEDAEDDFTSGISAPISTEEPSVEQTSSTGTELDDVEPDFSGSVLVLNAAGVDGLATEKAYELNVNGFYAEADTALSLNGRTYVVYNNNEIAKAKGVINVLGEDASAQPNDGTYSEDYDIIVILGTDNRY